MSYILDASGRPSAIVTCVTGSHTRHRARKRADLLRRPHRVWAAVAGALALGGAITFTLVRTPPTRPDPVRTVVAPAPPAPALPVAPSTVSPPLADPLPPAPLERALGPRPAPAPGVAPGPAVEHPSAGPRVTPAAPSTKVAPTGSSGSGPGDAGVPAQPAAAGAGAPPRHLRAAGRRRAGPADRPDPHRTAIPSRRPRRIRSPRRLPGVGGVRAPAAAPAPTVAALAPHARRARLFGRSRGAARLHQREEVPRGADGGRRHHRRADHAGRSGPAARGQRIVLRPKLNPYSRPTSP